MTTIEKLEKALTRATPPPWVKWVGHANIVAGPVDENTRGHITGGRGEIATCDDLDFGERRAECNTRLIVAAVNALPALLRVAKAAKDIMDDGDSEDTEMSGDLSAALRALDEVQP